MKILIGTPVHESKDYSMERWLKNVAKLQQKTPADFLMVDNSPGLKYAEKVKIYCIKYGLTNYEIIHIDFNQGMTINEKDERIAAAQETIRQEVIKRGYDAWFSWECDQIIPVNALDSLVRILNSEDFMLVAHNAWRRGIFGTDNSPSTYNTDMGLTLIKRECLKKHHCDVDLLIDRVVKAGGNYADVYGVIKPVYHLNDNK